jgi:CRISPR system Cascade subunit CasC
MFVELHILQNFAPCNLNRDDTGSPKDCQFGGYRRARVSSQCWKRAIRKAFEKYELVEPERLAKRTKRLVEEVGGRLCEMDASRTEEAAQAVATAALQGIGLGVGKEAKTEYLVFAGEREIGRLAEVCHQNWGALAQAVSAEAGEKAEKGAKEKKRAKKEAVPREVQDALRATLDGGRAVDLALFGRMVADAPELSVDAASQVAHAISTNRVSAEFDYYTAIDDLKPEETPGADMLGTVEFNSACFYRYANVDLGQLRENVQGDEDLARRGVEAFLRAAVLAVPTGKQNSMAAQNPPSFVMVVLREAGLWSLANAFSEPVGPDAEGDLVGKSIRRLDEYWKKLGTMYGTAGVKYVGVTTLHPEGLDSLKGDATEGLDALIGAVSREAFGGAAEA